ncbi:glycosyltransferase family 4 protein [Streptomyces prasinopilosus]|uniref:Glycosyltransferase involved in cell wall bisynthesis n=2 Tax=Streptomyces prasinopilosus TaxID=67344 RepID=A0A1G6YF29_9ACTN|nr:glycosyltransferase family 4 protein [Streptomyces prasinopilosus]SDD88603.1 Glycosyltransferase involved in cell wall bisynthesis [Streptomyces prasinopilosus]
MRAAARPDPHPPPAPLQIALIASARHPIRDPFAGGLEAHTWTLSKELIARGHEVTVFAGPGSDPALGVVEMPVRPPRISEAARWDASMVAPEWLEEHHAYLQLMLDLSHEPARYDIVHNNSLHYLPVAMAAALPVPVVTTLHTPPTPWLESAVQAARRCPVRFSAVSEHTATSWRHVVPDATVVRNGIDTRRWHPGPGGEELVWSGRIVPEKGAHLAIEAARLAGRGLRLAGPVGDAEYFEACVRPRLGRTITYEGHLPQPDLCELVGSSAAAVVTPCWDEPYGLVTAEALACGTPVCGFDRGALPEIVTDDCARLVPPGDCAALAKAVEPTIGLSRAAARRHAESFCSVEVMTRSYERFYRAVSA